jgi:hypothetical protein
MSLIENVHEEGSMAWTSRGVKAQGETSTTSQLFLQR